jgi:hypothetical protein
MMMSIIDEDHSYMMSEDDELLLTTLNKLQQQTLLHYKKKKSKSKKSLKQKKKRGQKGVVFYINEKGETKVLPPTLSTWYLMYVQGPALHKKTFHTTFRNRFRMPYQQYLNLVDECMVSSYFKRWSSDKSSPMELLILACLRYLGRGWTFDDLQESTGISSDVI